MRKAARGFDRAGRKGRLEALRRYVEALNEFSDRVSLELPQGRPQRVAARRRRRNVRVGPGALKLRMASELIPYLGAVGANRILKSVSVAGEAPLPAVESVLGTFLGKVAASRLVDRMIERTRR